MYDLILKSPLQAVHQSSFSIKKLLIIPDGVLSYVPFEMLFDSSDPSVKATSFYSKLPFLIKKYTISYAYSGNLLMMQNQRNSALATEVFAGFAAQYKPNEAPMLAMRTALTRDNAYDLPHAQEEVKNIYQIIGGELFIHDKSGEYFFKKNAHRFKILHFAMHAVPDSANPLLSKLLFTYNPADSLEDNDLTVSEIYAMHFNAELAVLSACQTGYGKINRGEGVISMSRAFAYSGVNATVMSLWKVDDFSTSEIMTDFYKNLKAGQPKDEALRNAKLTYLENHAENDLKSPFYWAAFITAGNSTPIDMTSRTDIWLRYSALLVVFVSLILYLKSRK